MKIIAFIAANLAAISYNLTNIAAISLITYGNYREFGFGVAAIIAGLLMLMLNFVHLRIISGRR